MTTGACAVDMGIACGACVAAGDGSHSPPRCASSSIQRSGRSLLPRRRHEGGWRANAGRHIAISRLSQVDVARSASPSIDPSARVERLVCGGRSVRTSRLADGT